MAVAQRGWLPLAALGGAVVGGLVMGSLLVGSLMPGASVGAVLGAAQPPAAHVALQRAALAAAGDAGLSPQDQQLHDQAVLAFRTGRHAAAYGRFMRLADGGHLPSAHSALFMLRHGVVLFGSAWSASEDQVAYWNALVIQNARTGTDWLAWQVGD